MIKSKTLVRIWRNQGVTNVRLETVNGVYLIHFAERNHRNAMKMARLLMAAISCIRSFNF